MTDKEPWEKSLLDDSEDIASMNQKAQKQLFEDLHQIRLAQNMTAEYVAENMGISLTRFHYMESGSIELRLSELRILASILEVVIEYDVSSPELAQ